MRSTAMMAEKTPLQLIIAIKQFFVHGRTPTPFTAPRRAASRGHLVLVFDTRGGSR
jgi:hypothetical protein